MTSPVPRWVIILLGVLLVIALPLGWFAESTAWGAAHSFSMNLLSSLATFAASGVFAALVINRLARRRFWSAELDARTRTAVEAEFLVRDVLSLFGETNASDSPKQVLERLITDAAAEVDTDPPAEAGARMTAVQPHVWEGIVDVFAQLDQVESRFSFLEDPELIYRARRLARKGEALKAQWILERRGDEPPEVGSPMLLVTAAAVVDAAVDLRFWAQSAPDRRMKAAVGDLSFRSDLD